MLRKRIDIRREEFIKVSLENTKIDPIFVIKIA
jgi:hypothetical protein